MKSVRAVAHVHSEWSYDAQWKLAQLASSFRRRGVAVVLAAEHDRGFSEERLAAYRQASAEVSTPKMLVVPGVEYSDAENVTHVLVWGDLPFFGEGLPTGELLRNVEAHNGIAVLAHPWRKDAWSQFDPEWRSLLLGIELWNRKSDGWCPEPRAVPFLTGDLLPFASLDFHRSRQFFPLRMRLEIEGTLSDTAVLDALRNRRCSPRVLGMPAEMFASGAGLTGARAAEAARRGTLASVRRLRFRVRLRRTTAPPEETRPSSR